MSKKILTIEIHPLTERPKAPFFYFYGAHLPLIIRLVSPEKFDSEFPAVKGWCYNTITMVSEGVELIETNGGENPQSDIQGARQGINYIGLQNQHIHPDFHEYCFERGGMKAEIVGAMMQHQQIRKFTIKTILDVAGFATERLAQEAKKTKHPYHWATCVTPIFCGALLGGESYVPGPEVRINSTESEMAVVNAIKCLLEPLIAQAAKDADTITKDGK